MITVQQAETIVLSHSRVLPDIDLPLDQAYGAVLRGNIYADRDQPPCHRSTMDGVAIAFSAWQKGVRTFKIAGLQKAGIAAKKLINQNFCFEITTGAVLPQNCDCVIPVEKITVINRAVVVNPSYHPHRWQFLHLKGTDYKKGALLLTPGTVLNPAQIAVAAAVGHAKVKVSQSPRIAVIGTGDELVEIGKSVKVFQSRRSNAYALGALLKLNGFAQVTRFHLPDHLAVMKKRLRTIMSSHDVLILSGGVSMGQLDLVPKALKEIKAKVLFHKVRQKPGKPFWFGMTSKGQPIFALPGNPVSTQICAYRYVLPYLRKGTGSKSQPDEVVSLAANFDPKTSLTFFLPVSLVNTKRGEFLAKPAPFAVSGNYASLVRSDGFIQLDPSDAPFRKGKVFRLFRWR